MQTHRISISRGLAIESLEARRLLALTLNPLPTNGGIRIESVDTDSAGNIYAAGVFSGRTTFDAAGKIKLTAIGETDAFIMRIAVKDGATIVRRLACTAASQGVSKLVSALKLNVRDGHVTVAGVFTGHVDLDPTSGTNFVDSKGVGDSYVLDLSTKNLAYNWSTTFGGTGEDDVQAIGRDSLGNTWVAGFFQGTLKFPGSPTPQLKSGGSFDAFVAKFSPTGQCLFGARVGGGGDDVFRGIAIDSKDNILLGGQFQGKVDTNPGTGKANLTTALGTTSGMVVQLSNTGAFKASRGLICSSFGVINDIEVDSKDAVYLMSNFDGIIDADPSAALRTVKTKGAGDVLLTKLDSSLNLLWADRIGGTGTDRCFDLYIDSKDQALLSGSFEGKVDFDPGTGIANVTADGQDGYLACFNANGKFLGGAQIGGAGPANSQAVARTGSSFIVMNIFQGVIDLAPRKIPVASTPSIPKPFNSGEIVDSVMVLVTAGLVGAK